MFQPVAVKTDDTAGTFSNPLCGLGCDTVCGAARAIQRVGRPAPATPTIARLHEHATSEDAQGGDARRAALGGCGRRRRRLRRERLLG